MADRPRGKGGPEEGSPEYNWLYGGRGAGDDDATRVVPTQGSGRGAHDGARASSTGEPDHTRVMPAAPREQRGRDTGAPPPRATGGSGRGAPPPRPPKKRRPRFRFGWIGLLLVLWLVFLLAVPFWAWTKVDK